MTNTTIGEQLRKARLAQNLDLSQIADETKISKYYLEAIEGNQIERLPGLFFYKAFVRQYSKHLKVDGKAFESQINAEHGLPDVSAAAELRPVVKPLSINKPALRAAYSAGGDMRLVLASVGLIVVLVGGSFVYKWTQRPARTVITDSRAADAQAMESKSAVPQLRESTAGQRPEVRQVTDNLTPEAGPESSVSLSLSATEATWITITSDGKMVYTGVLEPQQSKLLAGKQRVMIKVGNAAGLDVKWNGKPIGKLGDQRQVRTILFTDKDYQIMTPPPASGTADPISG